MLIKKDDNRWIVLGACTIALLAAILSFPLHRYYFEADAVSYLTIAENYRHGYWYEAINSIWPPLMSWLLALLPTDDPQAVLLAYKWIGLAAGCATTTIVYRYFVKRYLSESSKQVHALVVLTSFLMLLAFCWRRPVDVLQLPFLLLFLDQLLHRDQPNYWVLGLYAAIAFFAKSYNLYFCTGAFLLLQITNRYSHSLRASILSSLKFCLPILVLVGLWNAALIQKHERFIILSEAGPNLNALRMIYPSSNYERQHPAKIELHAPQSPKSVSFWETRVTSQTWTTPFSWRKYAKNVGHNFNYAWTILHWFNPLLVVSLIIGFFQIKNHRIRQMSALIVLYLGGYVLILFDLRFSLLANLVSIVIVAFLCQQYPFKNRLWIWVGLFGLMSFAPLKRLFISHNYEARSSYELAAQLEPIISEKGALVASNTEWDQMVETSYLNNYKYHGVTKHYRTTDEASQQLKALGVDYFCQYGAGQPKGDWKKIGVIAEFDLVVYRSLNSR